MHIWAWLWDFVIIGSYHPVKSTSFSHSALAVATRRPHIPNFVKFRFFCKNRSCRSPQDVEPGKKATWHTHHSAAKPAHLKSI